MAFSGFEFLYNGISSANYGLVISEIDDNTSGTVKDSPFGSGVKLITQKLTKNPKPYLYYTEQGDVLEFDLVINALKPLSSDYKNAVGEWLFDQPSYRRLQIVQNDMEQITYNCIITTAVAKYVGNLCIGWTCHVICDSPFAWKPNQIYSEYGLTGILNKNITVFNTSANNRYTYPIVEFTTTNVGNYFSITNITDNNLVFSFTNLQPSEHITVDCERKIITGSSGLPRIGNFNLSFLELVRGINTLTLNGPISDYKISFAVAIKNGG